MSGGNCPETPRQKMIGMMYLFLTAMLAVNVSSSVLEGFVLVDKSLQENNEIFRKNNVATYNHFKAEVEQNAAKYGESWKLAQELSAQANHMCDLVDSTKWFLARKADGVEGDPNNLKSMDNVDVAAASMLMNIIPGKPTKGEELKAELDSYRQFILEKIIVDQNKFGSLAESVSISLNTDDVKSSKGEADAGVTKKWEQSIFENIPIGAIMPLLSKIQTDIRNTEALAIAHLFGQVGASDFSVNKFESRLVLDSKYLVKGSVQNGMALLGAVDSTKRPVYELFINGSPLEVSENGSFQYPTNVSGKYEITGNIQLENEDGEMNIYPFPDQIFEVGDLSATVSATKMNVLYAGIANPMSVSVPGFSANDISVRFSDGSKLVKSKTGNYLATPKSAGKTIEMIVSTEVEGKSQVVGKYPFRVKSLPPPAAFVVYPKEVTTANGKTTLQEKFSGGRLKKVDLMKSDGLVAELLDSDFEVNYKITGFDITLYDSMGNAKTYSSKSSKFTSDQKTRIRSLAKGKQFFVSNIEAMGPDGIPRRLPPIDITIN